MSKPSLALRHHLTLVALFALGMIFLWTLPVLLVGYPYALPMTVKFAQAIAESGEWLPSNARLMPHIILLLQPLIGWTNISAWIYVSASAFACALLFWWYSVFKIFTAKIAWFSTIVLALLPIYWVETLDLGGYAFAILFLFMGFALYLRFQKTQWLATLLFAICFGLTLASKDAFVAFIPWLTVAYLWHRRRTWKIGALETVVALFAAYVMFTLPLYPRAQAEGMSFTQRVAVFLPSLGSATPGEGHLYPDEYLYEFHRTEYDEEIQRQVAEEKSFFGRQQDQHYRLIFGVGDFNVFDSIFNGFWLFLNTLPQLFVQEYVGGAFLWIFILPGMIYVYRKHRHLFWNMIGLWLSMELLLRFALHFGRTHLNDIAWELALFAGVGLALLSTTFVELLKIRKVAVGSGILAFLVAFQLVQANRKLLAFEYSRSRVPEAYAAETVLENIPEDAVVAHPRVEPLFFFSDREQITVHPATVEFLEPQGKLSEPFAHYGVTHILGYDAETAQRIKSAVPSITILELSDDISIPTNPLVRYLLHLVR